MAAEGSDAPTGEQAEPARVRARQQDVAKAEFDRAGLALEQPAEGIDLLATRRIIDPPGGTGSRRVAAAEHKPSRPSRRSRNCRPGRS